MGMIKPQRAQRTQRKRRERENNSDVNGLDISPWVWLRARDRSGVSLAYI